MITYVLYDSPWTFLDLRVCQRFERYPYLRKFVQTSSSNSTSNNLFHPVVKFNPSDLKSRETELHTKVQLA